MVRRQTTTTSTSHLGDLDRTSREAINRLELATGEVSLVATLDTAGSGLTGSPDEAFIVWFQTDRRTTDLMLVENFR